MISCVLSILMLLAAQDDDPKKLRDELVKARLESLSLKLQLARVSSKPDDELKILEEALDAPLPEVVAASFRELGMLAEDRRKAAVPFVLRRYIGGRDSFRLEAVNFLGRIPMPEAETTVLRAAADGSPAVRKAVAGALKRSAAPSAVETLMLLFRDPDRDVRLAALDGLGVAKRESAVGELSVSLAAEQDPLIVEKTVDALGLIGSPAATESLVELLSTTPKETIRWSCINSLGMIGDLKAGPRLLAFMEAPQPMDVRQVTIEALGKIKETSALPRLAELLTKSPEEKIRQSAAAAFGMMAGAGSILDVLVPAYLADSSEPVRKAIWTSLLALTGDGIAANEKLAQAFLAAGRRSEAEQICTRLHGTRPEGDLKVRRLTLEETIARTLYDASDYKAALPHYRQLPALAPDRTDAVRRVAACQRELKDYDGCLKTLGDLKDPEPLIDEIAAQIPVCTTEDRKKALEAMLRAATLKLLEGLAAKEDVRAQSLESVRRLGRKILPPLIAELEEGPKTPFAVLEAGSVVTGISNDAATASDFKSKAASWRAWLEK